MGDLIGAAVLGAQPGETLVSDSTTVNLFKLAGALLAENQGQIVGDAGDFPTNRYVLDGLLALYGRSLHRTRDGLADVLTSGEEIALVCLSHVDYRTGELLDTELVEALSPAPVIWDLSHSAGVAATEGHPLRGGGHLQVPERGPGAPGFLYVREDSLSPHVSPIQGWFGHEQQFEMGDHYEPARGLRRFLTGTPNVPALMAIEEGVRVVAEAGIDRLRAKAEALTSYAVELHDAWLAPLGFELAEPARPGPARRPRERAPRRGVADLPRAHRACASHPRLPRAGPDPARLRAALHALRRRSRCARPAARAGRSAATTTRSTPRSRVT